MSFLVSRSGLWAVFNAYILSVETTLQPLTLQSLIISIILAHTGGTKKLKLHFQKHLFPLVYQELRL